MRSRGKAKGDTAWKWDSNPENGSLETRIREWYFDCDVQQKTHSALPGRIEGGSGLTPSRKTGNGFPEVTRKSESRIQEIQPYCDVACNDCDEIGQGTPGLGVVEERETERRKTVFRTGITVSHQTDCYSWLVSFDAVFRETEPIPMYEQWKVSSDGYEGLELWLKNAKWKSDRRFSEGDCMVDLKGSWERVLRTQWVAICVYIQAVQVFDPKYTKTEW